MTDAIQIRRLHTIGEREIQGLSDVLIDCVEGGASVSFMLPMTRAKAETFWRNAAAGVARGERVVLSAEDETGIVGTVQIILAQPENQPHRQAVVLPQTMCHAAERHLVGTLLNPDLLVDAHVAGAGLVGHPGTGRQHDLDDLDGRGEVGRRDVAPHVA